MDLKRIPGLVNGIYFGALALAPLLYFVKISAISLQPAVGQMLGFGLFVVAILDYLLSLWMEGRWLRIESLRMRSQLGQRAEASVANTALFVAGLGAAPAVYAGVGILVGVPQAPWVWLTWGLSVLAFIRQRSRWDKYEEAVRAFEDGG